MKPADLLFRFRAAFAALGRRWMKCGRSPIHSVAGEMPVLGRVAIVTLVAVALWLTAAAPLVAQSPATPAGKLAPVPHLPPEQFFQRQLLPFVAANCLDCHSGDDSRGGLPLDKYVQFDSLLKHRKDWVRIAKLLRSGLMPPEDGPQPPREQVEQMVAWLELELNKVDCDGPRDPGRVTLRRLNRTEYNNTIRDLTGVEFRPADDFPADDVGYGFDNIGDVLSLPPLLMEKYLAAAERIATAAIVAHPEAATRRFGADELRGGESVEGMRGLYSTGEASRTHRFSDGGRYKLRISASGDQAGPDPARMEVRLDGRRIKTIDVKEVRDNPAVFEVELQISAGRHDLAAAFVNDYYQPRDPNPNNRDRNLYVGWFELVGPLDAPLKLPESHQRIVIAQPGPKRSTRQAAAIVLQKFVRRAWRRPPTEAELSRLVGLVELAEQHGENYEFGLQLAVQATLASPHFLFRVEADPAEPAGVRELNEHELAVRLSYFLWSTMPDDELATLADQGRLRRALRQQVDRMLADERSAALAENFADQWLHIRNLETAAPSREVYPSWSGDLRSAMQQESRLFFAAVLRENRSLHELVDADFTYLNDRLARHYGIRGVTGREFRRVQLKDPRRGGVLTQASVLTVTSNPTRTSPVKRGKWILEQLLGIEPPPPPPEVEELKEEGAQLVGTLRQRLEQHRSQVSCAICHRQMDPLGFGLENFDGIGAWREKEGSRDIDATGEMPDGTTFRGPGGVKEILRQNAGAYRRCFAEKLLTYALGRGVEYYDKCALDEICQRVQNDGDRMHALVHAIVASDPFQKRRGKRGDE